MVSPVRLKRQAGRGGQSVARRNRGFLIVPTKQLAEASIGGVDKLFDTSGKLINDGTWKFPERRTQTFASGIDANV